MPNVFKAIWRYDKVLDPSIFALAELGTNRLLIYLFI